ncbi:MAG: DAK2 domain-containing protein [Micrococcales bacterium]|nr:DAK2 domain-containing protein [Micrococcales bacterium]
MLKTLDAAAARQWALVARAAFAARRAEIDALNVFPVPDGDTGTNLYLTFDGGLDAVRSEHEQEGIFGHASLLQEAESMARAMLLTARGNSGVILSQMCRGLADAIREWGVEELDTDLTAQAIGRVAEAGRRAVTRAVEGTILTVADSAAHEAARAAAEGVALGELTGRVTDATRAALEATTGQLDTLASAGVVDAGGAGFLILMEALDRVVRGEEAEALSFLGDPADLDRLYHRADWAHPIVAPTVGCGAPQPRFPEVPADASGPAYEVMYLLDSADSERVTGLSDRLDSLGDSVLVVGGPDLWNVHVHTDDIGAAIEAGIEAGRPHRISVTAFEHQPRPSRPAVEQAVIACSAGPGITALLQEAGALTVPSGPGRRASAGQILDAVRAANALHVLLLPNDSDTVLAAQAAASAAHQDGIEVHVVRSRTAVQGIAALAVFDPSSPVSENAASMSAAAAGTRNGAVTVATKEALTSAGWCHPGDVLGVVSGEIEVIGSDQASVASDIVGRLLSSGGELLTVIVGSEAPDGLADELVETVRRWRRDLDISVVEGGQPLYSLLLGVE